MVLTDAQPSPSETDIWENVKQTLEEAQVILNDLQEYRGAGEEIRQVMGGSRQKLSVWLELVFQEGTIQVYVGLSVLCVHVQAIQSPGDETVQEKAWSAVVPLVAKLKTFYEFSHKLGKTELS